MSESKVTDLNTVSVDAKAAKAAATPAKKAVTTQSGHNAGLSGNTKVINIFASEHEGGNFAALVGLNGVMYQIPRGVEVEVPSEVLAILHNAVTTITLPKVEGGVSTRDVPRYNVQVVS